MSDVGMSVCLHLVYVHSSIYEMYLVQWFSRNLCSIGGGMSDIGMSVCLHSVYVHTSICETYFM